MATKKTAVKKAAKHSFLAIGWEGYEWTHSEIHDTATKAAQELWSDFGATDIRVIDLGVLPNKKDVDTKFTFTMVTK